MSTVWQLSQQYRLARFLTVGGFCGLMQIGLLEALVKFLTLNGVWLLSVANAVSFTLSALVKFFLTYNHVYADRRNPDLFWGQLVTWSPMQLILTGINLLVFSVLNTSVDVRLASAFSIVITLIINWVLNEFVFRGKRVHAVIDNYATFVPNEIPEDITVLSEETVMSN